MVARVVKPEDIIVREEWNVRTAPDHDGGVSLVASVKAVGILQPLIVNSNMELVAGHRRLAAARAAGLALVPVEVRNCTTPEEERLVNIDENLERQGLEGADLDRALAIRKKVYEKLCPASTKRGMAKKKALDEVVQERGEIARADVKSFTQDTADRTGMSERTVQQSIKRSESASPAVLAAYDAGELKQKQVDYIVMLDHELQDAVLPKVKGMSTAETEDEVRKLLGKAKKGAGRKAKAKAKVEEAPAAAAEATTAGEDPMPTIPPTAEDVVTAVARRMRKLTVAIAEMVEYGHVSDVSIETEADLREAAREFLPAVKTFVAHMNEVQKKRQPAVANG